MIGGCKIVCLFMTLSTGIRLDNRLAGKSKYDAPETNLNLLFFLIKIKN